MIRGLYIGRFQPMHKGHLDVLRYILGQTDELIIAIGSAQESHTPRNPFTAGERFEMIRSVIREEGFDLSSIYIVPVEDVKRNSIWVSHVLSLVPHFDVVYANEPLATYLFEEAGFEVRKTLLFSRSSYSSTHVRESIVGGSDWQDLVPPSIFDYIRKKGGVERMVRINSTDKC